MKHILFIVTLLIAVAAATSSGISQWSHNPNVNTAISTAANDQQYPTIASDGAGGAIITWMDLRGGTNYDIYAQRINASGVVQWTADGVAISTAANEQSSTTIVSDGAGGAIITWNDYRSGSDYDIYAQRINSAGVVQWTANGVAISTAASEQQNPTIVSDGAVGAIITWSDIRSGNNDIYAQRINSAGVVQWTANGVAISTAANQQQYPAIVTDGAGGAIITWHDSRSGTNYDIYAQRINSAGVVQWTADGVAISTAADNQYSATIVSDGAGGAIITWIDYRSGTNYDIYAQRINSAGVVQWTANGVAISTAASDQYNPTIVSDGAGGAIITWFDSRNGTNYDIYAQRISSTGVVQWTANGVAISTAANDQQYPTIASDGAGGAIITWQDTRNGLNDIYAQRINAAGAVQWEANGLAVATSESDHYSQTIVSDGAGGAIITWYDSRNITNYNIYAQLVNYLGTLGTLPLPLIVSINDIPDDQGGKVRVKWAKSWLDSSNAGLNQIVTYGVWRKIPPNMMTSKMNHASIPLVNDTLGTLYDFIVSVPAVQSQQYNVVAPTLDDSITPGTHYSKFLVTAHTDNPSIYYISSLDSGYSVDNLPPGAVLALAAEPQVGPSVNVHWKKNTDDPDVGYYEVHRSTTSDFTPSGATKIGQTSDTLLVDASPVSGSNNYYRIVTVDVHGNISDPSSQASAGVTTTVPYSVASKWNLVSVPLTVSNYSKSLLYPTATSNAFAFQNGYSAQATLVNGTGYWLKFGFVQTIGSSLPGLLRTQDSISVQAGWNMIGSISSSVATSGITSNPGGMVTSNFFGYNNGYYVSNTIEPGKGYWVKVNQSGKLILTAGVAIPSANRINIVPTAELPPSSPEFEINNSQSAIPKEFALEQNYPNPFNPTTVIQYAVPSTQYVSLKVYNMLGEEVATLVDGVQEAGYKSVEWDASGLPSGIYVYKMNAGTFVDVRKMLILK